MLCFTFNNKIMDTFGFATFLGRFGSGWQGGFKLIVSDENLGGQAQHVVGRTRIFQTVIGLAIGALETGGFVSPRTAPVYSHPPVSLPLTSSGNGDSEVNVAPARVAKILRLDCNALRLAAQKDADLMQESIKQLGAPLGQDETFSMADYVYGHMWYIITQALLEHHVLKPVDDSVFVRPCDCRPLLQIPSDYVGNASVPIAAKVTVEKWQSQDTTWTFFNAPQCWIRELRQRPYSMPEELNRCLVGIGTTDPGGWVAEARRPGDVEFTSWAQVDMDMNFGIPGTHQSGRPVWGRILKPFGYEDSPAVKMCLLPRRGGTSASSSDCWEILLVMRSDCMASVEKMLIKKRYLLGSHD